jgi:hypothetical protein
MGKQPTIKENIILETSSNASNIISTGEYTYVGR